MTDLRIFSYLPNPRLYKATITARFSGAVVEVVGDSPPSLINWLWDYDARELTNQDKEALKAYAREAKIGFTGVSLYKSNAFLAAHPFGNVPAGFLNDGDVGVFESNSIMRAAARAGKQPHTLLGDNIADLSRIDSFLDRSLVFARDLQHYLLAGDAMDADLHKRMAGELASFASGIELALDRATYIAGDQLTLADICIICDLCQITYEFGHAERFEKLGLAPLLPTLEHYGNIGRLFQTLAKDDRFAQDLGRYFKKILPLYD